MLYYQPSVHDMNLLSFDSWYPAYKQYTIPSYIVYPTPQFIEWLKEDGINIKEGLDKFSELAQQIDEIIINKLGKHAFVKLNWTAPIDATYASLDCQNSKDVLTVLKCSELLNHDLYCPYEHCVNGSKQDAKICIALREWIDISNYVELRCFVYSNKLIGISQRDKSQCKIEASIIRAKVIDWQHRIANFPISTYTYDVLFDGSSITLIDVSEWNEKTMCTYLFTIDELIHSSECQIRLNDEPIMRNGTSNLTVPLEMQQYGTDLLKLMEEAKQQNNEEERRLD